MLKIKYFLFSLFLSPSLINAEQSNVEILKHKSEQAVKWAKNHKKTVLATSTALIWALGSVKLYKKEESLWYSFWHGPLVGTYLLHKNRLGELPPLKYSKEFIKFLDKQLQIIVPSK